MNSNLIDFSKKLPHEPQPVDSTAAKIYFINEILPYVCAASMERLITANVSGNLQLIQLEMMRMYVESEITRPTKTAITSLNLYFLKY